MKFNSAYSKKDKVALIDCQAARKSGDIAQTVQSDAVECDINVIYNRYLKKGIVPDHLIRAQGVFADATSVPNFHEAQNIIAQGNQLFDALPSRIREKFHNDPQEYLDFVFDPKNGQDLVKMGLARLRDVSPPLTPAEPIEAPAGGVDAPPRGAQGLGA